MFRFALVLGAAVLGLALVGSAAATPAEPRVPGDDSPVIHLTLDEDGDFVPVVQKGKVNLKNAKHYSINKRLQAHKGQSGEYRLGTTPKGRKINAHLKNGKVSGMNLTRVSNGDKVKHGKVFKRGRAHSRAASLPKPAKGVRKVSLTPGKGLEDGPETYRVNAAQGVVLIGFLLQTPTYICIIWVPQIVVVQQVVDTAVPDPTEGTGCGDEVEVRAVEPVLPLLAPRFVALPTRRDDLEVG